MTSSAIITEFVENREILAGVRELGMDYAQGSAISYLVPLDPCFSVGEGRGGDPD